MTGIRVPAGVIQPMPLLKWLNRLRDEAETEWTRASRDDDFEQMAYKGGFGDALTRVIEAIGDGSYA